MFVTEQPKSKIDFHADYATRADFCELLERDLKQFYLLAFLLTANHKKAEQCFAATIEEALKEQAVFKDWACSWIKRSLIKNAIGIISPTSTRGGEDRESWSTGRRRMGQRRTEGGDEIDTVTQLPPLERFVFVMSVLERYSPWECAGLLGCGTKNVVESRMQAWRRLGSQARLFPLVEAQELCLVEILA